METERPDLSQLIPPLPTNTQGVHRLLSAFRSGTTEIKSLLNQECNVILECKTCQNMFRSLPNFISHKRVYCLKPAPPLEGLLHNNKLPEYYSSVEAIENELGRRDIDQIATRLSKTATIAGTDGIRGENPEASQNVAYFTAIADTIKSRRAAKVQQKTILTPIPGTSQAVSQTIKIEESDGGEEKSSDFDPPNKKKAKKSDDKSANANSPEGTKSQNNAQTKGDKDSRYTVVQYPCPLCKKVFSKPNGTYRHIRDIHKKNNEQLEKMKNTIRKKAFSVTINKKTPESQSPPTQNNNAPPKPANKPQMVQASRHLTRAQQEELKEWNDHTFTIDVGDHRCGYCGTKYDRRAALLSHAKQCYKKLKIVIKKPAPQPIKKSKGAANRKVNTPMKIVRKYLMGSSKPESVEEYGQLTNGVTSTCKDVRRSTRKSGNPVGRPRVGRKINKDKLMPTVPLTRLKLPLPEQTKPPPNPKPPVPVAPLQSPLELEKMLRDQKSNTSNILVRQVSDKAALSPSKATSPAKEPPAVASVTPILSLKPKDGYPVNYFSPGSADTKLIGTGNSVPSSIQIRKDYKKSNPSGDYSVDGCSSTASVCSDKAEDCVDSGKPLNSVITPCVESAKNKRPVLNFDKPITSVEKMQPIKVKELVGIIQNLTHEVKVEEAASQKLADGCKACADENASNPVSETPQPESSNKEKTKITQSKDNLTIHTLKQLTGAELSLKLNNSATRIVAVPLKSLEKIPKLPNSGSAIQFTLSSDVLSSISKVVTSANNSSPSTVVDLEKKSATLPSESTSPSKSPTPCKNLPDTPSTSTNNNVPETYNFVPEERCEVMSETANSKPVTCEEELSETVKSDPKFSKDLQISSQSIAKKLYPNLDVPAEYLIEEDSNFEGWDSKEQQPSLALVSHKKFFKFHAFFEEEVKKFDDFKVVVELDSTDPPLELPPGVLVEYQRE